MTAETLNFIDGRFVPSSSGRLFENRSPVDHALISRVHEAGRPEVDAAVAAARAALAGPWGRLSVQERAAMLYAVADEINRRFDDFLQAEVADTGKPIALASHLDIPRGAANFKIFADTVKSASAEFFEMTTPDGRTALNYALRRPKGVVAVICPWNLPLLLMTWKVGPALACGNAVVVKPSEETPSTATLLGEVMNAVGVPSGVYNVVHGFGPNSAGEFLTRHPDVNAITFTGETATGTKILEAAAGGIKATSMELGGKNPSIVFADCDLDNALEVTSRAVFANCGQVCLGTERVYVERPLFETFVQRLGEIARAMKPGRPDDAGSGIGPLISLGHRDKVLSYYARAKEEGATIVAGGGIPQMPAGLAEGAWIEPTVWTGLPETSAVVREEIFGPCCHVTPFDSEDEVVALANDTQYGLAASVHTRDLQRAHRVAARLDVGLCWVNAWFLRDLRTPFGGAKMSGIGREGGLHSLEFYTELRNVCVKL
ncbi:2-hydroxymuconic semialdehyde dehydrogenase [Paraburkholderia sp. ZP32-5]|uniref:2-hydroxymuconic semialdehyde dehydrogenase n=1 Tax=Paraburkholderia sp. ZP32-5 TaxID=2883245 RepID=UPI001F2A374B|nr:2-hydroxymuconic semialdehyde dehydrogenase [Paraburkholderia sp. ZP32-5]